MSTAFVHGRNSGTPSSPLPQRLPDLGGRDPGKLYRSAQIATSKDEGRQSSGGAGAKGKGGRSDATNALKDLGYPNTYTFTKAIGEHLLARAVCAHNRRCRIQWQRHRVRAGNNSGRNNSSDHTASEGGMDDDGVARSASAPGDAVTLTGSAPGGGDEEGWDEGVDCSDERRCGGVRGLKLRVVRPSIVGPSWVFPWAGWTGEQPSTVTGGSTRRGRTSDRAEMLCLLRSSTVL